MLHEFFDENALKEANGENKKYWNGYAMLFDIIDSTNRKRDHASLWYAHTDAFYKGVKRFSDSIFDITTDGTFAGKFESLDDKDKTVVVKFVGDSGLIFLPQSYASSPSTDEFPPIELSVEILSRVNRFCNDAHTCQSLGDMKLKTVVTYLTKIRPIRFYSSDSTSVKLSHEKNISMPQIDIIARGIDFTFRLEKFAGHTHVVINKMLGDSITDGQTGSSDEYKEIKIDTKEQYYLVPCRKNIKGWEGPQTFYLLVSEAIHEKLKSNPSVDREDVEAELLGFLVRKGSEKERYQKRKKDVVGPLLNELNSDDPPHESVSDKDA